MLIRAKASMLIRAKASMLIRAKDPIPQTGGKAVLAVTQAVVGQVMSLDIGFYRSKVCQKMQRVIAYVA